MPCCCVPKCSERSEKGIRLFLLPQGKNNVERRKKWIVNIKREDELPKRAFVCQKHFTKDQFENNRQDGKKPLKWDAVPTIFPHKKMRKSRKPPTPRCIPSAAISTANDDEHNVIAEEFAVESPNTNDTNASNDRNPQVIELQRKLGLARKKIAKLTKDVSVLETSIKRLFGNDQIHVVKCGSMKTRIYISLPSTNKHGVSVTYDN